MGFYCSAFFFWVVTVYLLTGQWQGRILAATWPPPSGHLEPTSRSAKANQPFTTTIHYCNHCISRIWLMNVIIDLSEYDKWICIQLLATKINIHWQCPSISSISTGHRRTISCNELWRSCPPHPVSTIPAKEIPIKATRKWTNQIN